MQHEQYLHGIQQEIGKRLVGRNDTIELLWISILAKGHVLLDDLPGTGKSELAKLLATVLGAEFGRVQGTSDVTPSDVTGFYYYNQQTTTFDFRKGPIFNSVLLFDEINRASPRAQAGLLEAMAERQVTIDGHTMPLPETFFVLATQNPVDQNQGTFALPHAQLDRFLMKLSLEELSEDHKRDILRQSRQPEEPVKAVLTLAELQKLQEEVTRVSVSEEIDTYLLAILASLKEQEETAHDVGPRAALALLRAAQARAAVHGRSYVLPEDVFLLAEHVLAHRIQLQGRLTSNQKDVVERAKNSVPITIN
ncbi:MoxR family ATPase [Paenalkalicoccus suaedae]|uniref:MoxR family ATPase n=1 Tax=Paenalkalicoccus suaedae TaxID=2592382 RepID=A0A859FB10_9BACI|nr:MoxR family ATPase [Paenalkalicoccus suaedae]QKS70449.1 MoxR family ATPase [Paenalkalicoccus suaedae]